MSSFDLRESLRRARERFGTEPRTRRSRSDRGRCRLPAEVVRELQEALQGQERPPVRVILKRLERFCRSHRRRPPSRATVYQLMARLPGQSYRIAALPAAVRETLFNLPETGAVPGHQLAFHCLNYGGLRAMSFAAGLPWLALYQAARLRAWRPRSRSVLEALLELRGI